MPLRPFRFEEDRTGLNPNNLVPNEEHTLPAVGARFLVTKRGPYYTESIRVVEKNTGRVLAPHLQYRCLQLEEEQTLLSGKEVCSVVVITDPTVTEAVLITYQAYGGWLSYSITAVVEMIEALQLDETEVTWGQIVGVPDRLPAAPHRHPLSDVYGWHKLFPALGAIRDAIMTGNQPVIDALRNNFQIQIDQLVNRYDAQLAQFIDHVNAEGNAHNLHIHEIFGLTEDEIEARLQAYLPINGTAVNADKVYGYNRIQLSEYINNHLNNALMDSGIFPIDSLANGMRFDSGGNRLPGQVITEQGWRMFKDLLTEYLDASATTGMYYVGAMSPGDIQLMFADEAVYPSPILVGFQNSYASTVWYGNGAVTQYYYDRGLMMKFAPGAWARVSSW